LNTHHERPHLPAVARALASHGGAVARLEPRGQPAPRHPQARAPAPPRGAPEAHGHRARVHDAPPRYAERDEHDGAGRVHRGQGARRGPGAHSRRGAAGVACRLGRMPYPVLDLWLCGESTEPRPSRESERRGLGVDPKGLFARAHEHCADVHTYTRRMRVRCVSERKVPRSADTGILGYMPTSWDPGRVSDTLVAADDAATPRRTPHAAAEWCRALSGAVSYVGCLRYALPALRPLSEHAFRTWLTTERMGRVPRLLQGTSVHRPYHE
jgi:hypothetical protein